MGVTHRCLLRQTSVLFGGSREISEISAGNSKIQDVNGFLILAHMRALYIFKHNASMQAFPQVIVVGLSKHDLCSWTGGKIKIFLRQNINSLRIGLQNVYCT